MQFPAAPVLRRDDAFSAFVRDEPDNLAAGLQRHIRMLQCRVDEPGLGVALGADLTRKGIASSATNACAAGMEIDRRGHVKGVQAESAHAFEGFGDDRFVRNRRMRIGRRTRRLGRIVARLAVHPEQPFGLTVPWFEIRVAQRPWRGPSLGMLDAFEIAFAEAEHCRAVNLGVAADEIELSRTEWFAVAVVPGLARAIALFDEHRLRTPVLGFPGQAFSAFQDQDACAGPAKRKRDRSATDAGTDDDHVVRSLCRNAHAISFSVLTSKHTSLARSTKKRASCPGFSVTSGSSRTVNSFPLRSSTASVSAPVGSITSTRASKARSVLPGIMPGPARLTASARMPAITSAPMWAFIADGMSGKPIRSGGRVAFWISSANPLPSCTRRALIKFMRGDPMKPATNVFAGRL